MSTKNNRRKGCEYERDLASLFRSLGWLNCRTSRYESKFLDDQKVDLTNTKPFQIQAKSTQRLENPHTLLKSMPQKSGIYNIIFNKKLRQGEIVIMSKEDFLELVGKLINSGAIIPDV